MDKNKVKIQANYWYLTAEHDRDTMSGLFKLGRYSDALFYGHIVIEKILKALVVVNNEDYAPLVHDLNVLARLSGEVFSNKDAYLLKNINNFNIRARYPDHKFNFYKKCDYQYSRHYLNKINGLYKKLCLSLKQKIL